MRTMIALLLVASTQIVGQTAHTPSPFKGCIRCHGVPDKSYAPDRLWIERVKLTACVQPLAPKGRRERRSIIEFLNGKKVQRPQIEKAVRKAAQGEGVVTVSFEMGSLLLMAGSDSGLKPVRMIWNGEQGEGARRVVPAGRYRVRNLKVLRQDKEGVEWQLWGSGKGPRVNVVAGKVLALELDLAVNVQARAVEREGQLRVGIGVTGPGRMGMTVIRADKRIDARYGIELKGKRILSGSLSYG